MPEEAKRPSKSVKSNYSQTALVLQGGGALGAYQAGAFEALASQGYEPDWYAGISIGAINAAIMAGNQPGQRIERLNAFWQKVTAELLFPAPDWWQDARSVYTAWAEGLASMSGVPGFFRPRLLPPLSYPRGFTEALSFYDTSPLRATLEELVDFDRINSKNCRLSLGAVNIRTGNFCYFDNTGQKLGPEHVMASAALPPGFPPVEIGGELYWDGGLVSNTPLVQILSSGPDRDTLIFQVDLFGAVGQIPQDIFEVEGRRKDIVYSSRTRLNTDMFREIYSLRRAVTKLSALVPEEERRNPEISKFQSFQEHHKVAIVHLIYRRRQWENHAKDYEFSRPSMLEHWRAGFEDASITLQQPLWNEPATGDEGVRVFDLTRDRNLSAE
jgi:NTE family protein